LEEPSVLKTLNDLLEALKPARPTAPPEDQAHALQLATAVLLVEVMRADPKGALAEKPAVLGALREKFALAEDELARLFELAEQRSIEAHDLHSFTARINAAFAEPEKLRILEMLWQVAYADGHLDAHETHLMRRLADLLHVRHSDAVVAKLRGHRKSRS
jgi:uncharacterized tellurite resistance protein B-like protein